MIGDWVTFEAAVEPLTWERATYTIIRLPPHAASALPRTPRVKGEIAEHPVSLALSRAPVVEGLFLWAGKSLLDRIGLAPGEVVEIRLRPATDDALHLDPDVKAALHATNAMARWERLTPGRRRGLLYQIATARTEATRAKRIARMIEDLP